MWRTLDEVRDIHRHLIDLGRVVLLDVAQYADIVTLYEIDRDTLTAETARPTNAVDVQLTAVGQVVADDLREFSVLSGSSVRCVKTQRLRHSRVPSGNNGPNGHRTICVWKPIRIQNT